MSEAASGEAGRSHAEVLRETVALAATALVTRGELAALELDDARRRAGRWLAYALAASVLLLAALLTGALLVAAVFWDTYRWEALAVVLAAYAIGAAVFASIVAAEIKAAPPLLGLTMHELKQDCASLRGVRGGPP